MCPAPLANKKLKWDLQFKRRLSRQLHKKVGGCSNSLGTANGQGQQTPTCQQCSGALPHKAPHPAPTQAARAVPIATPASLAMCAMAVQAALVWRVTQPPGGHSYLLDCCKGGILCILDAQLPVLQLSFCGCTNLDHSDTARQLGNALAQLLSIIHAVCLCKLLLQLRAGRPEWQHRGSVSFGAAGRKQPTQGLGVEHCTSITPHSRSVEAATSLRLWQTADPVCVMVASAAKQYLCRAVLGLRSSPGPACALLPSPLHSCTRELCAGDS